MPFSKPFAGQLTFRHITTLKSAAYPSLGILKMHVEYLGDFIVALHSTSMNVPIDRSLRR